MRHDINIQDGALFGWLKEAKTLRFELTNGKSVTGHIVRFDRYCVLMEAESGAQVLLYKHALLGIFDPKPAARGSVHQHHRPRAATASPRRVAMVGQRR